MFSIQRVADNTVTKCVFFDKLCFHRSYVLLHIVNILGTIITNLIHQYYRKQYPFIAEYTEQELDLKYSFQSSGKLRSWLNISERWNCDCMRYMFRTTLQLKCMLFVIITMSLTAFDIAFFQLFSQFLLHACV